MAAIDFPNSPALNDEFVVENTIYRWNGSVWEVKQSTLSSSSFSNNNPIMNGVAAAGSSGLVSRSDHVHPSDTSRASAIDLSTHMSATTTVHGITNTTDLVYTNDSRLTDSRTPTTHASSHGSAGGDPITIAQSQVTNLTTDLSSKSPSDSPTFTGTVVLPSTTSIGNVSNTEISYLDGVTSSIQTQLNNKSNAAISTNVQTASYTLVSEDAAKLIEMNVGSSNTVTIPLDSSVNFPIGTKIDIVQTGAGTTQISPASGVTLNSDSNKRTLNAQWAAASLIKRASNTWLLVGALKA